MGRCWQRQMLGGYCYIYDFFMIIAVILVVILVLAAVILLIKKLVAAIYRKVTQEVLEQKWKK